MDTKSFANRLNYHLKVNDIRQNELADRLGVSKSTVSAWCNGYKMPRYDKISKMAEMFSITESELINNDTTDDKMPTNVSSGIENMIKEMEAMRREIGRLSKPSGHMVPVLGRVQAGIPIEAVEEILDYEEISADMAARGEYFALSVKGASMEPRMREGDVVIVRQQEEVENGETAIVLVNGCDATIKKIGFSKEGIILIPTNPVFETKFYSNQEIKDLPVRILGKVVELRAKF